MRVMTFHQSLKKIKKTAWKKIRKVHVHVLVNEKKITLTQSKFKIYFLLETPCKFPSDPLVSDADKVSPIPFWFFEGDGII